jgi:hypothetical protein
MPMIAAAGLMMVCCSSSSAMMMMGGDGDDDKKKKKDSDDDKKKKKDSDDDSGSDDEDAAPDAPPPDPYRIEAGIDYPGSDIFHYWPGGAIKATKDVCLDKCTELPACKLVTFNNAETLCWGKSAANNKKTHGDRNNYFKN